ncbi:predicted protein, partial [Naegleria gruberi]
SDNRNTFEQCTTKWLNLISQRSDAKVIVIATKTDVGIKNRTVSTEEGLKFANEHGFDFVEICNVNGDNLSKLESLLLDNSKEIARKMEREPNGDASDLSSIRQSISVPTNSYGTLQPNGVLPSRKRQLIER